MQLSPEESSYLHSLLCCAVDESFASAPKPPLAWRVELRDRFLRSVLSHDARRQTREAARVKDLLA